MHDVAGPGEHPGRDPVPAVEAEVNTAEPRFHLGYRRSLDGLRGVAIMLVLLHHAEILGNGFGFIAVNTFFVLSGFLITCLLIEEWDTFRRISLKFFYFRRALRLLPALSAMLLVFIIFAFLAYPRERALRELSEALYAFFYSTNWAVVLELPRDGTLGHTWSLSIEEQFYFIWPLLLSFLLLKTSRRSLLYWVFLGAFASALLRWTWYMYDAEITRRLAIIFQGTEMRADSLLLGCFVGVLLTSNRLPRGRWFLKAPTLCGVISAAGLAGLGTFGIFAPWVMCYGWFLDSALAAVLITQLAGTAGSLLHKLFENPVLVYIGQISYGLYVWHQPLVCILREYHLFPLPWQKLAYVILPFLVAIPSYYLIERPCLRLKTKFKMIG
ncbi:MAG: acyltransferase [Verrucomicrobiae bacterium]|nr:acyltransferase [Verrucomicrobiae bacterium]